MVPVPFSKAYFQALLAESLPMIFEKLGINQKQFRRFIENLDDFVDRICAIEDSVHNLNANQERIDVMFDKVNNIEKLLKELTEHGNDRH